MRHRAASLVALVVAATATSLVTTVRTASAADSVPTAPDASFGIPLPVPIPGVGGPCDVPGVGTICGAVGGVLGAIPNPIGAAAGAVAGAAEREFTHWLADAAASLLGDVLNAADTTLAPDLGRGSFAAGRLQAMVGLSGGVALLFLLFAVGQSLLRADPTLMVRAVAVRLPIAMAATAALLFLTVTVVSVVDEVTAAVIGGGIEQSASAVMRNLAGAFGAADFGGTSPALVALCALGTILVGIVLYAELAIRMAVIYLTVLFLPLGLAAGVWPGAGRVARRLVDILVAAVLAKFAILATLWFAAGLLEHGTSSGGGSGFGAFVEALVLLTLAAAAPIVLLSLVAHAEEAVGTVSRVRSAAYAPPQRVAATTLTAARISAAAGSGGAAVPIVASSASAGGAGSRIPSVPLAGSTGSGSTSRVPIDAGSVGAVSRAESRIAAAATSQRGESSDHAGRGGIQ